MKNILITGAQMANKGAQSMLFITAYELKKRFKDCNIYFATNQNYDEKKYTFIKIFDSKLSKEIAIGEVEGSEIIRLFKNIIKLIIGKPNNLYKLDNLFRMFDMKNKVQDLDMIVDISGFALGDQWPVDRQEDYLLYIKMARKFKIPIILMPQSFGPFDESKMNQKLMAEMQELLSYPDYIFAREKAGYDVLVNHFGLKNVALSRDLVLQNKSIDKAVIYNSVDSIQLPKVKDNAVAIIPNKQCISQGDEKIYELYDSIIELLSRNNFNIYIFGHCSDDNKLCEKIYKNNKNNPNVYLLSNDFSCLEYDEIIKRFSFIVCSRYHGIVHAYRNSVPAIILGWAVKYEELAESVNQRQYAFNASNANFSFEDCLGMVQKMAYGWKEESEIIGEAVKKIQKESCFNVFNRYL